MFCHVGYYLYLCAPKTLRQFSLKNTLPIDDREGIY